MSRDASSAWSQWPATRRDADGARRRATAHDTTLRALSVFQLMLNKPLPGLDDDRCWPDDRFYASGELDRSGARLASVHTTLLWYDTSAAALACGGAPMRVACCCGASRAVDCACTPTAVQIRSMIQLCENSWLQPAINNSDGDGQRQMTPDAGLMLRAIGVQVCVRMSASPG